MQKLRIRKRGNDQQITSIKLMMIRWEWRKNNTKRKIKWDFAILTIEPPPPPPLLSTAIDVYASVRIEWVNFMYNLTSILWTFCGLFGWFGSFQPICTSQGVPISDKLKCPQCAPLTHAHTEIEKERESESNQHVFVGHVLCGAFFRIHIVSFLIFNVNAYGNSNEMKMKQKLKPKLKLSSICIHQLSLCYAHAYAYGSVFLSIRMAYIVQLFEAFIKSLNQSHSIYLNWIKL